MRALFCVLLVLPVYSEKSCRPTIAEGLSCRILMGQPEHFHFGSEKQNCLSVHLHPLSLQGHQVCPASIFQEGRRCCLQADQCYPLACVQSCFQFQNNSGLRQLLLSNRTQHSRGPEMSENAESSDLTARRNTWGTLKNMNSRFIPFFLAFGLASVLQKMLERDGFYTESVTSARIKAGAAGRSFS